LTLKEEEIETEKREGIAIVQFYDTEDHMFYTLLYFDRKVVLEVTNPIGCLLFENN